nr:hypothetical protein [Pararobbsia silviterrae]
MIDPLDVIDTSGFMAIEAIGVGEAADRGEIVRCTHRERRVATLVRRIGKAFASVIDLAEFEETLTRVKNGADTENTQSQRNAVQVDGLAMTSLKLKHRRQAHRIVGVVKIVETQKSKERFRLGQSTLLIERVRVGMNIVDDAFRKRVDWMGCAVEIEDLRLRETANDRFGGVRIRRIVWHDIRDAARMGAHGARAILDRRHGDRIPVTFS